MMCADTTRPSRIRRSIAIWNDGGAGRLRGIWCLRAIHESNVDTSDGYGERIDIFSVASMMMMGMSTEPVRGCRLRRLLAITHIPLVAMMMDMLLFGK